MDTSDLLAPAEKMRMTITLYGWVTLGLMPVAKVVGKLS